MDRRALLALLGATAAAGRAEAATGAEFPFRVTRNQPWAAVTINDREALAFLIDTGSTSFAITTQAATNLALPRATSAVARGFVGRTDVPVYVANTVVVGGGVKEHDVALGGLDVGSYDLISGLIPIAKFGVMGLDFDRQMMLVAKSLDGTPEGYDAFPTFVGGENFGSVSRLGADDDSRSQLDHRPVIEVELDGEKIKLMVDTGAHSSILLRPDYVRAKGLWDHYPRSTQTSIRTIARSAVVRVARAGQLKIGRFVFQNPLIELGDPADSTADGNQDVQGLIGMELIRRFNLINHPGRKRLYLKPSQAIQDLYRYDRAGLEIDSVDGALKVVWVRAGGAAAKAGLTLGDKVTGWRGRDGYYGLVWALTGAAGTKIEIQVERGGAQTLIPVTLEETI